MARYFNAIEARCKDAKGTYVPPQYLDNFERVACQADEIREALKRALFVVSGYRTPEYNKGASESMHLTASALDLRPSIKDWYELPEQARRVHVRELYLLILELIRAGKLKGIGGVGYYPGKFVHIDIRPRKPNGRLYWFGKARHGHLDGTLAIF